MTDEASAAKRKKFLKIKFAVMIFCVAAAVIIFILVNLYRVSDEMAVGVDLSGKTLYFGETTSRAKSDLGEPYDVEENDGALVYHYSGTSFDSLCDAYLTFREKRLVEASFYINKMNDFDKFDEVIGSVGALYKDRGGYFITDKATYDSSGYCRISGKVDGAELVCDIYNKENIVYIETHAGN